MAFAQALTGISLFEHPCATCHSAPAADSHTPDRHAISLRTPESILDSLTSGSMRVDAAGLSPARALL